jgi:hypothetical protein
MDWINEGSMATSWTREGELKDKRVRRRRDVRSTKTSGVKTNTLDMPYLTSVFG